MLRTFKSRVVRRTFWLIKMVPTWKKFEKRCSTPMEFCLCAPIMHHRCIVAIASYREHSLPLDLVSWKDACSSLSTVATMVAIFRALSTVSGIWSFTWRPGAPVRPLIKAARSRRSASRFTTSCSTALSLGWIVRWHIFRRWSRKTSGLSFFSCTAFCSRA